MTQGQTIDASANVQNGNIIATTMQHGRVTGKNSHDDSACAGLPVRGWRFAFEASWGNGIARQRMQNILLGLRVTAKNDNDGAAKGGQTRPKIATTI